MAFAINPSLLSFYKQFILIFSSLIIIFLKLLSVNKFLIMIIGLSVTK